MAYYLVLPEREPLAMSSLNMLGTPDHEELKQPRSYFDGKENVLLVHILRNSRLLHQQPGALPLGHGRDAEAAHPQPQDWMSLHLICYSHHVGFQPQRM